MNKKKKQDRTCGKNYTHQSENTFLEWRFVKANVMIDGKVETMFGEGKFGIFHELVFISFFLNFSSAFILLFLKFTFFLSLVFRTNFIRVVLIRSTWSEIGADLVIIQFDQCQLKET